MSSTEIRLALTAGDHEMLALLVREYVGQLPFELDFQDIEKELAGLPTEFGPPHGASFLATIDDRPVGMVLVRRIGHDVAEMKRMYVQPAARGQGLGAGLGRHAIAAAQRAGASRLLLDTDLESMAAANRLYESLGFVDTAPYRHNPLPGARFLALDLGAQVRQSPRAVVLTGGPGSRMNADKSTVAIAGASMRDRVVEALAAAGLEVAIANRTGEPVDGFHTVADAGGSAGPAGGLLGAFRRFPGTDLFVAATDQPYLRSDTVRHLLSMEGDAVVALDVKRQTMGAVYRHGAYPTLERLIQTDHAPSLQRLLDELPVTVVDEETWRGWGEDGRSWISLDTPDEVAAAARTWPDPPPQPQ